MRKEEYTLILKEHFDITDNNTRKIMLAINEEDQNHVLSNLTSKLYDHIVEKVDDIDYGDIPQTKGDITKLPNYLKLVECLEVIRDLLLEYKQSTKSVDTIIEALDNLKERKELFEKGFRYNIEFPMIIFSTISLSVISATSFLIASCIEFIKSPNQDNFDIIIDKVSLVKTKDNLLFENLDRFNKICNNGQLDKSIEYIIKSNQKNLTGIEPTILVGSVAIAGLILNIIPIMRELIFFFYYSKTRMADYLELQSELLQINAYNIEHSETLNKNDRKSISSKQYKIAEKLRKMSNFLEVKIKKAEKETSVEISNSNKKYKTDELVDELPDSASSALF